MTEVANCFAKLSAKKIRDYAHGEKGYAEIIDGQLISFEYAHSLSIH